MGSPITKQASHNSACMFGGFLIEIQNHNVCEQFAEIVLLSLISVVDPYINLIVAYCCSGNPILWERLCNMIQEPPSNIIALK